jgi:hypothetical protein
VRRVGPIFQRNSNKLKTRQDKMANSRTKPWFAKTKTDESPDYKILTMSGKDKRSNFVQWAHRIKDDTEREFDKLGSCIRNGRHYVHLGKTSEQARAEFASYQGMAKERALEDKRIAEELGALSGGDSSDEEEDHTEEEKKAETLDDIARATIAAAEAVKLKSQEKEDKAIRDQVIRDIVSKSNVEAFKYNQADKNRHVAMWSFIWTRMSEASQAAVELDPRYALSRSRADPLDLWKIIEKVHSVGVQGLSTAMIKSEVMKEFYTANKGKYESLASFKREFDARANNMRIFAEIELTEHDKAVRFLDALDREGFADFKRDYQNKLGLESAMYKNVTLADMYSFAEHYVTTDGPVHREVPAATFNTRGGSDRPIRETWIYSSPPFFNGECRTCKAHGHLAAFCPTVTQNAEMYARNKAAGAAAAPPRQ